jgi:outer membrane protein assembly factor BamE (lipoprotein component of BamABCDE complex)
MGMTLAGCLLTVDSDGRLLDSTWDEGDVNRLQVGSSDVDWVRSTLGEPSTRLSYADGTEVWKYRNRSEKDTEVGLFLVFSVDVEQERTETLSIEFDQNLVTNYWIESDTF